MDNTAITIIHLCSTLAPHIALPAIAPVF